MTLAAGTDLDAGRQIGSLDETGPLCGESPRRGGGCRRARKWKKTRLEAHYEQADHVQSVLCEMRVTVD